MDLITNETSDNHLGTLRKLIRKSEKILIAVAFLKKSGLVLAIRDIALFGTTSHTPETLEEMQARVIFSFQTILPLHTKS